MAKAVDIPTEQHWADAWGVLAPQLAGRKVLALEGDLGAGKTTFVKTIAARLGFAGEVTSPTFSIVQEYPTPEGMLYHFDLYRLETVDEVLDLDFERYLDDARFVVVEWPRVAEPMLPPGEALWAKIEHLPTGGRRLLVLGTPAASAEKP